jgi:glutathione S-transferase
MIAPIRIKMMSFKAEHPPDEEVLAFVSEGRKPTLDILETLLGKYPGGFLVGEHPTIADLQIFFEATDEILQGRNFDEFPKIKAWFEKMQTVPEVKKIHDEWTPVAAALVEKFK